MGRLVWEEANYQRRGSSNVHILLSVLRKGEKECLAELLEYPNGSFIIFNPMPVQLMNYGPVYKDTTNKVPIWLQSHVILPFFFISMLLVLVTAVFKTELRSIIHNRPKTKKQERIEKIAALLKDSDFEITAEDVKKALV